MSSSKYIDQFLPLVSQHDVLKSILTTPEEITTSLAALQAATKYGTMKTSFTTSSNCSQDEHHPGLDLEQCDDSRDLSSDDNNCQDHDITDPSSILCLVMGENETPRTAIVAAICFGWTVVAISKKLDKKWQGIQDDATSSSSSTGSYLGFHGTMEDFLVRGKEMMQKYLRREFDIQHIVIMGIESTNNSKPLQSIGGLFGIADLRGIYDKSPATVILVSSEEAVSSNDVHCGNRKLPFNSEPKYSFVDGNVVASSYRHVSVWKFPRSKAASSRLAKNKNISSEECSSQLSHTSTVSSLDRHSVNSKANISTSSSPHRTSIDQQDTVKRDLVYTRSSRVAQLQMQQTLASESKRNRLTSSPQIQQNHTKEEPISDVTPKRKASMFSFAKGKSKAKQPAKQESLASISNSASKTKAKLLRSEQVHPCKPATKNDSHNSVTPVVTNRKKLPVPSTIDVLVDPSKSAEKTSEKTSRNSTSADECVSIESAKTSPEEEKENSRIPSSLFIRNHKHNSSLTLETTSSSLEDEDLHCQSDHAKRSISRSKKSPPMHEFKKGDMVEIRIGDIFQLGTIEQESFKGVYNVKLFEDTPAWKDLRTKVNLYDNYFRKHGIIPEVPARQLRPFRPAEQGEVLYVWLNGKARQFQIQGFEDCGCDGLDLESMKYIVRFASKSGEGWRTVKHRVHVQKTYRQLFGM